MAKVVHLSDRCIERLDKIRSYPKFVHGAMVQKKHSYNTVVMKLINHYRDVDLK